ncbi:hypothetical protein [Streptomyces sp. NPDC091879]|uniref:hypothetical protein n=1 Tax=Streptomyces sp. NPDC091879 TaxID=3366006 RepID=UPI0037F926B7
MPILLGWCEIGQVLLDETVADARLAAWEFDGARAWLGQNQPAAWFRLDTSWDSVFPEDRERIRAHARRLAAGRAVGSR